MVSYLATATVVVSLLAALPEAATPTVAPEWESDYGKALQATRADDRPLLVVLDYPSDAASSDAQAANTHQVAYRGQEDAEPAADQLKPYHLCRIDVSTEYGKKVAEVFGVTSFPYTAIIDKSGSVIIYAKNGTLTADQWQNTLLTHKAGERPEALVMSRQERTSTVRFQKSYEQPMIDSSYCPSCQRGYCASCQKNGF